MIIKVGEIPTKTSNSSSVCSPEFQQELEWQLSLCRSNLRYRMKVSRNRMTVCDLFRLNFSDLLSIIIILFLILSFLPLISLFCIYIPLFLLSSILTPLLFLNPFLISKFLATCSKSVSFTGYAAFITSKYETPQRLVFLHMCRCML